ncbi:hypothetical protein [Flavobacterium kingsejongi]|uniref:Uncharacterized protein n=1 Tax=Flavobacterium kingsejongi TaxID=1678728 RepID=A0A2S1LL33_9FLAO|nr:hypothetical protein [Flavobacterium kingsejongi]AWG24381.1 hypothetical protein FK004_03610 [Flavobacterium kingsejongi]
MEQQFDFDTILESIKNWNSDCKDLKKIESFLAQGTYFDFEYKDDTEKEEKSDYLHAYPGICKGELKFFLIPSNCDKFGEERKVIEKHITVCNVKSLLGNGHEISKEEAMRRIQAWDKDFPTWAKDTIDTKDGIYKAFAIPTEYLKNSTEEEQYVYQSHFALKPSDENKSAYSADLVIVSGIDFTKVQEVVYYDTVRPVPPFKPFDLEPEHFNLLKLAEKV